MQVAKRHVGLTARRIWLLAVPSYAFAVAGPFFLSGFGWALAWGVFVFLPIAIFWMLVTSWENSETLQLLEEQFPNVLRKHGLKVDSWFLARGVLARALKDESVRSVAWAEERLARQRALGFAPLCAVLCLFVLQLITNRV
jgi:hypothetical protein